MTTDRKKGERGLKIFAYTCIALAAALLAIAGWLASPHLDEALRWKRVEAKVVRTEFVKGHDAKGYLNFDMRALFRYDAEEKQHMVLAESNFKTHNFPWLMARLVDYAPGSTHTIFYRAGSPEDVRFEAGFTWRNFRYPLAFAGAGLGLILAALISFRMARPLPHCKACQGEMERDFKHCPYCAAAL
jgi:hypothetical protein